VGGGGVMVTSPQGVVSGVPGLPLVASVSAAVPMVREEGVPGEVVPEPGAEGGRVGQIMRFGFPGLDNIRSHRDYVLRRGLAAPAVVPDIPVTGRPANQSNPTNLHLCLQL